ncbi:hypothetical protein FK530_24300 [Tsukamurella conjunctivitidis]|uniref:Uncharacterized protein n=1 Tax=Tsukamurella conjunctivitidis TaxID=2592068 RepID=A0A5C5RLM1_9ACTN|nr:hypothetical protein [Tsukamurella conjunctivitidis]TWS23857.1 hypothetical protein FK530_24300 [Tsukamurella conjunctivitidis]
MATTPDLHASIDLPLFTELGDKRIDLGTLQVPLRVSVDAIRPLTTRSPRVGPGHVKINPATGGRGGSDHD